MVAHLHFLPILNPKLKNAKELPSLHTTTRQKTNEMERLEKALGHNKLKNAKELPSLHTTTRQKTNEMKRLEKALGHNRGLNAMGAEVVNSTIVLLLNFCDKLNICASNPPLRQAPKR